MQRLSCHTTHGGRGMLSDRSAEKGVARQRSVAQLHDVVARMRLAGQCMCGSCSAPPFWICPQHPGLDGAGWVQLAATGRTAGVGPHDRGAGGAN